MADPVSQLAVAGVGAGMSAMGDKEAAKAARRAEEQRAANARKARDELLAAIDKTRKSKPGEKLGLNAAGELDKGSRSSSAGLFGKDYDLTDAERKAREVYGGTAFDRNGDGVPDSELVNQFVGRTNYTDLFDPDTGFAGLQGILGGGMQAAQNGATTFGRGIEQFLTDSISRLNNRLAPGTLPALAKASDNNLAFTQGIMPAEDRLATIRTAAETGLPGANRAHIGRDLGLGQLQLMRAGQEGTNAGLAALQSIAPVSLTNPTQFQLGIKDLLGTLLNERETDNSMKFGFEQLAAGADPGMARAGERDLQLQDMSLGTLSSFLAGMVNTPASPTAGGGMSSLAGFVSGIPNMANAYTKSTGKSFDLNLFG